MTTPEGWGVVVDASACVLKSMCPFICKMDPFVFTKLSFYFPEASLCFLELPFCLSEVAFGFREVPFYFSKISYCFLELSFIFQKCILFNYCARLFPRMLFLQNDICLAPVLLPLGTLHGPTLDIFFITLKSLHRASFFSDFLHCPWQCKNKVPSN